MDAAVEVFLGACGPCVVMMEAAMALGHGDQAREQLRAVLAASNQATDGTLALTSPYLLSVARRGPT